MSIVKLYNFKGSVNAEYTGKKMEKKYSIEELRKLYDKIRLNRRFHDEDCRLVLRQAPAVAKAMAATQDARNKEDCVCTCGLEEHIDCFINFICDNQTIKL